MNRLIATIGLLWAALAVAQTARLGQPLSDVVQPPPAIGVVADPNQPPSARSSEDDAVLELTLPKAAFDAGEAVTLGVKMRTRSGAALHPAIETEDLYQTGVMDRGARARKRGTALDNRPGDHTVTVYADAVDAHGNSVHRATPGRARGDHRRGVTLRDDPLGEPLQTVAQRRARAHPASRRREAMFHHKRWKLVMPEVTGEYRTGDVRHCVGDPSGRACCSCRGGAGGWWESPCATGR
jgi:hypothetical protein